MFGRSMCTLAVLSSLLFSQQQVSTRPERDTQAVEILERVEQVAGGAQVLASVHDTTEYGEITFYWGHNIKGPLVIRTLGGNHFRMEATLPQGKSTWIVKDGVGSKKESEKTLSISRENALNLGNLTFPAGHVAAALTDSTTNVSFVGVEKRDDTSVYRIRVKGRLGLASDGTPTSVVKDLIINALTYDILSVEDHPYRTYKNGGKPSDAAPRVINFGDYRAVSGVRVPFSVSTKLQGQQTLSIQLNEVSLNNNLTASDFQLQK
jgi:hypothetical protein